MQTTDLRPPLHFEHPPGLLVPAHIGAAETTLACGRVVHFPTAASGALFNRCQQLHSLGCPNLWFASQVQVIVGRLRGPGMAERLTLVEVQFVMHANLGGYG